ncbi:UvrD-helicase domain-containing protein [Halobaculum rarum]|uniref:UvrD-helicase domain-containing protein n=1 Tax=Halobaculum rarum TaxID=3075122 RepID=UPI0032AEB2FE
MPESTNTNNDTTDRDEPTELRDAQKRIRDAYFDQDTGLYVLNCNPGAGKSVTITHVAAEELLRRYVAGDSTPEQHLCVVSFTRDDAADFVPAVIERLRELVEHDLSPVAAAVSEDDIEYLVDRVRRAPLFGTIDGVFRRILGEFVAEVGFAEMPDVGNDGQLTRLHADCYEELVSDPAYADAIDVVEVAYPPGEYDDGPTDLLRQALHHCRSRRLTTAEFTDELRATVGAVYEEGETASFDDIADALARCVGTEAATEACRSIDESDRQKLVAADQQIHTEWIETVDAFETLLDGYRETYQRLTRERGVISHTDCSYLVTEFLTGTLGTNAATTKKRERVLSRYQDRLGSVIIDEAQDISQLQHDALAEIVTEDCRVLAAGDLRQTVYVWRDAHPGIFERAVEEGRYLGIDWDTHVTETAATTYRCTPDVAAAINEISEPSLTDPLRGDIGSLDVTYPHLNAARDPNPGPSVHIAAFDTAAVPGSIPYIAPDHGKGEAGILATYVSCGLADGTFHHRDSEAERAGEDAPDDPDVTVLFRWRTHMDRYRQAFEAEGLTVADASAYLFDCPAVTAAIDVVEWLADSVDTVHTRTLVTESELGLSTLEATFEAHDWQLDAVRTTATSETSTEQRDVLDRLHRLREQRATFRRQSAAVSLADIIDTLALRADPNDVAPRVAPAQRVANLDKLVELVTQWETESLSGLSDLTDVLTQYRDDPHTGPTQPVHTDDHDVVFKTIHQMKGDESDVVALADVGFPLHKHGPVSQRLVATGSMVGFAPPEHATTPSVESVSVYAGGLYDPGDDSRIGSTPYPFDVGLRWASERWTDETEPEPSNPTLAGHDRVQTATRLTRAESWRLLFVALSRARNHLVVPLPREIPGPERPRDRWLESIRDGLGFDGTPGAGTYPTDVEAPDSRERSIDVAVNSVDTLTGQPTRDDATTRPPFAATTPPERNRLPSLVPRILRPSTLYPLSEEPAANILDHLQGRPLHTDTDTVDDELPLTLDEFDTEDVGTFVHSVLTTAVQNGVSATALRTVNDEVQQIIDDQLRKHGLPATDAERDGLLAFLTEDVLPDVVESDLWRQLERADDVYVEKRLRGHVRRNDVEFELEGQADFVLRHPDGTVTVTDTKIALTEPNADTRHRYRVQVACYAWLLARETDVDDPTAITTAVETFGAISDRTAEPLSPSIIRDRLDALLDGGR